MGIIVRKTNNLAEQERRTNQENVARCSQSKKWMPTNEREIKLFLGVIILQRIVQKSNQSYVPVLHTSVYSKVMPVNHFILFLQYLHFCANETEQKGFHYPKLWKFYNFIENLRHLSILYTRKGCIC